MTLIRLGRGPRLLAVGLFLLETSFLGGFSGTQAALWPQACRAEAHPGHSGILSHVGDLRDTTHRARFLPNFCGERTVGEGA